MRSLLAMIAVVASVQSASPPVISPFDIPQPKPAQLGKPERLWSTRYQIATATNVSDGVELRARDSSPLGFSISRESFCDGALQGTVRVVKNGQSFVLNANGLIDNIQAKCDFAGLTKEENDALGKQAFVLVPPSAPYGLGTRGFRLVPYRTIAVDKKHVGRAYFIPDLRGAVISTGVGRKPDGNTFVHDGFVFGADVGRAISYPHIDFFTGFSHLPPPKFVKSSKAGTFVAYPVIDQSVVETLKTPHRLP